MTVFQKSKKAFFVILAATHAITVAAFSLFESVLGKTYVLTANVLFLLVYALFFLYCITADALFALKTKNRCEAFKRRLPFLSVHISSFLLICGLLYNQLFFYKGSLILTEGESFNEASTPYFLESRGLLTDSQEFKKFLTKKRIQLMDLNLGSDTVPDYARISITDEKDRITVTFGPNRPAKIDDHYFYVTSFSGYSPRLKIAKEDLVLIDAYLALKESKTSGMFEDSFKLGPIGKITVSYDSRNRRVFISDGNGNKTSYFGPGESFALGDLLIEFVDVREWSKIDVTLDRAPEIMFFGSAMLLLSLSFAYFRRMGERS